MESYNDITEGYDYVCDQCYNDVYSNVFEVEVYHFCDTHCAVKFLFSDEDFVRKMFKTRYED